MRIVILLVLLVLAPGAARAEEPQAAADGSPGAETAELAALDAASEATPSEAAEPASEEALGAAALGEAGTDSGAAPTEGAVAAEPRTPVLGPMGYDAEGRPGRIHTVVGGDTLWDISDAYLGTPWVWPSIWVDNPEVDDPHRIYPGDRIWITPTSMRRVTPEEAAELIARVPEGADPLPAAHDESIDAPVVTGPSFDFNQLETLGFISPEAFEGAGSIIGTPSLHTILAQTRLVYISRGEGETAVGDRFDVVRLAEDVRDPDTGDKIGVFAEPLGWLEVTEVHPESSVARIEVSYFDMAVGDRIVERQELPTSLTLRPAPDGVEGRVAYFKTHRTVMAQRDIVFLNRGTDHGVEVGSPLEVYRPGTPAEDAMTREERTLPDHIVADLIVVSAEPTTSVAVVTHARNELAMGDHFRGETDRE